MLLLARPSPSVPGKYAECSLLFQGSHIVVLSHLRSAQPQKAAVMQAAVVASTGAFLASPLAAQAAVTPSLNNFLLSLVAGATVLAVIAGGITFVSNFDPVNRG